MPTVRAYRQIRQDANDTYFIVPPEGAALQLETEGDGICRAFCDVKHFFKEWHGNVLWVVDSILLSKEMREKKGRRYLVVATRWDMDLE